MSRKLTISMSEDTYTLLQQHVGRRSISRFLEDLTRQRLAEPDLDAAYREMAADEPRESEAAEWSEALIGDIAGEPGR